MQTGEELFRGRFNAINHVLSEGLMGNMVAIFYGSEFSSALVIKAQKRDNSIIIKK
jgi:hypothetical protein